MIEKLTSDFELYFRFRTLLPVFEKSGLAARNGDFFRKKRTIDTSNMFWRIQIISGLNFTSGFLKKALF